MALGRIDQLVEDIPVICATGALPSEVLLDVELTFEDTRVRVGLQLSTGLTLTPVENAEPLGVIEPGESEGKMVGTCALHDRTWACVLTGCCGLRTVSPLQQRSDSTPSKDARHA